MVTMTTAMDLARKLRDARAEIERLRDELEAAQKRLDIGSAEAKTPPTIISAGSTAPHCGG